MPTKEEEILSLKNVDLDAVDHLEKKQITVVQEISTELSVNDTRIHPYIANGDKIGELFFAVTNPIKNIEDVQALKILTEDEILTIKRIIVKINKYTS